MTDSFVESAFRGRVDKALERVKTVLVTTRTPILPADQPHQYGDKYALSEWVSRSSVSALKHVLTRLLSDKELAEAIKASEKKAVVLRWTSEAKCTLLRKAEREVESDTKHVNKSTLFGTTKSFTVTKITEWFWRYDASYALHVRFGTEEAFIPIRREANVELVTTTESSPHSANQIRDPIDLDVTWLLQRIDKGFSINRENAACRTPSRNPETKLALDQLRAFSNWAASVGTYFSSQLFPIEPKHGLDLSQLTSASVFSPVLPFFEKRREGAPPSPRSPKKSPRKEKKDKDDKDKEGSKDKKKKKDKELAVPEDAIDNLLLPIDFMGAFLGEQERSLNEMYKVLEKAFPASTSHSKLITVREAHLSVLGAHVRDIVTSHVDAIGYLEFLLRTQLIAAIGKEVQEKDVVEYQKFHARLLFKPAYAPKAFAYSIRCDSSAPEGNITLIDSEDNPIPTIVNARLTQNAAMTFPLSASAKVTFYGERFLHGAILPRFGVKASKGKLNQSLFLKARARQFSSFILLVGKIGGPTLFEPKQALFLKDKDELSVPLLLETIPTAKQFRDAISSLSDEQQRFAKAYRSLQLESTLFGLVVIQVKPQLEKLLKLNPHSLAKEIDLSQKLLDLFFTYQVPSDLLSYNGDPKATAASKVEVVRGFVTKMYETINGTKAKELEEALEEQDMRAAEGNIVLGRYDSEEEDDASGSGSYDGGYGDEEAEEYKENDDDGESFGSMVKGAIGGFFGGLGGIGGGGKMAKSSAAPRRSLMRSGMMADDAAPSAKQSSMRDEGSMRERRSSPRGAVTTRGPMKDSAPQSHKPPSGGEGKPSAPGAPKPSQPSTSTEKPKEGEKPKEDVKNDNENEEGDAMDIDEVAFDYTKVPTTLEKVFDEFDTDGAVRPTIINTGDTWTKSEKKSLLAEPASRDLDSEALIVEKNRAFDLLDALTKSGVLPIDYASLHVVVAATHCFDESVINTLVQDNINPIEKLERTSLLMGATIHQTQIAELIKDEQLERVATYSPNILPDHAPKKILALPASSSSTSLLPTSVSSEKLKVKK